MPLRYSSQKLIGKLHVQKERSKHTKYLKAAKRGLSPQLPDGSFATLHHIRQDSRGPLAEASTRYHGVGKYGQDILHSQFGKNKPNPSYPIDRKRFNVDTREYWQSRMKE